MSNSVVPAVPDLSVIVPVFNESAGLAALFARLGAVLDGLNLKSEIICIDDGSRDATWDALKAARATDARIKLVRLSRNFGKDVALTAGLRRAAGRAIVMMDADLQHPPELIPEFVARWREGLDMVYAVRTTRNADTFVRRWASRAFYRVFRHLTDIRMPPGAGDFRLVDRRVADVLRDMPERARFMKGLYAWVGFRHGGVPFDPPERTTGKTSFSPLRLLRFAVDALASFSTVPLVASGYIGLILAVPSLALSIFFIVRTLAYGVDVPGYASVIVAVLLLGSIQLLTLGLFGAYLGRVFEEVKGRPLFVESDTAGFSDDRAPTPRDV
ncbi:MAG: glycosyltransferase [Alphaproteobacteria bacterium]|nr:glycosyltransferase [Alphaproteobacteria bacterium]